MLRQLYQHNKLQTCKCLIRASTCLDRVLSLPSILYLFTFIKENKHHLNIKKYSITLLALGSEENWSWCKGAWEKTSNPRLDKEGIHLARISRDYYIHPHYKWGEWLVLDYNGFTAKIVSTISNTFFKHVLRYLYKWIPYKLVKVRFRYTRSETSDEFGAATLFGSRKSIWRLRHTAQCNVQWEYIVLL